MISLFRATLMGAAFSLVAGGCSRPEEHRNLTPMPSTLPSPQELLRNPPETIQAPNCFWKFEQGQASTPDVPQSLYPLFGSARRLCIPMEQLRVKEKAVEFYRASIVDFFKAHYARTPTTPEVNDLVFIAGIAPSELYEDRFLKAIDAMASLAPANIPSLELIKGCYYFNNAVRHAANRYSKPTGGGKLPTSCIQGCGPAYLDGSKRAFQHLDKMHQAIDPLLNLTPEAQKAQLTSDEQDLLQRLHTHAEAYEKTLTKK